LDFRQTWFGSTCLCLPRESNITIMVNQICGVFQVFLT
jgi:hypothetical protein